MPPEGRPTDSPNRTEPTQHESPTCWPGSEVLCLRKDVMCIIPSVCLVLAYWESNYGGSDEHKIHHHEDGLEFSHDPGHGRSEDSMARDTRQKNTVNGPVGGCVVAVLSNDDHREEHQREAVCIFNLSKSSTSSRRCLETLTIDRA